MKTYLNDLVTAGRDNLGLVARSNTNTSDPVGVALGAVNVVHLVTNNVPDTDGLVTASRDNHQVVGSEGTGHNITLVSNETDGSTIVQVPKTKGLVPRGGESVVTVVGKSNVLNDVRVAVQRALGDGESLGAVVAVSELPNNQSLVAGSGDNHVGNVVTGSKGSNPVAVALKGIAEAQSLRRHDV